MSLELGDETSEPEARRDWYEAREARDTRARIKAVACSIMAVLSGAALWRLGKREPLIAGLVLGLGVIGAIGWAITAQRLSARADSRDPHARLDSGDRAIEADRRELPRAAAK